MGRNEVLLLASRFGAAVIVAEDVVSAAWSLFSIHGARRLVVVVAAGVSDPANGVVDSRSKKDDDA
jgi:hypothetical protein